MMTCKNEEGSVGGATSIAGEIGVTQVISHVAGALGNGRDGGGTMF